MYFLNKCALVEGIAKYQGQEIAITHLHLLALGIFYVSQPFLAKKMRKNPKYAQLLDFNADCAILIGEITPTQITDKLGNVFKFDVRGYCFIENFLIHRKTEEKELKSTYTTSETNFINAVKLISTAIHFQNRLLNTSQSQWRKETYYYCEDKLKYVFDRNGIYDADKKLLFSFQPFFVNKTIPKRLMVK